MLTEAILVIALTYSGTAAGTVTLIIPSSSNLAVTNDIIFTNNGNGGENLNINTTGGTLTCNNATLNNTSGGTRDIYFQISNSSGEININGNLSMPGANNETYILFTDNGKLNVAGTITGGAITSTAGGGTNAPTFGTVNYNSNSPQNIGAYTYYNLEISNGGTKTLTANTTINNQLTLTSGILDFGNFNLILAQAATIGGSPSATAMCINTGTGRFTKNIATGDSNSFTFPLGETTGTNEYTPLTIDFSSNSVAGTVSVGLTDDVHPNNGTPLNSISRYWSITTTGLTNYTYDLSINYTDADIAVPATEGELSLNRYSTIWNEYVSSINTVTNTISITGLTQTTGALNGSSFTARKVPPMFNYTVRSGNLETTYNWIDCSDGTQLLSSQIVAFSSSALDDGYWLLAWPFNFSVYKSNYTSANNIGISTNGFLKFDGTPSNNWTDATNFVLNATGVQNTISGQQLYLGITDAYFAYPEEKVLYKVTGTAPNRIFTIEFQNMGIYGNNFLYIDIQASFYETTNIIVLKVGNNNFTANNADIGIHSGQFGYYHYWQDARYSTPYTWLEYSPPTGVPAPQDANSYVSATGVTQPTAGNIASSVNNAGSAVPVFKFKIHDQGTSDGASTKIQRLRIKRSTTATPANWFNLIGGVVFSSGSAITNGVVSVNPDYLDVQFDPGAFTIANGASAEITMSLYLKNANQSTAGQTFAFYIDIDDHWFAADYSGSQFQANFGGADIVSNTFTITYTATELRFITEPVSVVYINTVLTPNIRVALTDAAGNIATSVNSGTITLSNTDGLTMTNFTATLTNGIATFSNLQFTASGGPLALTTSNVSGYSNTSSNLFTVAVAAVLFEDDFSTDKGWTTSGTAFWARGAQTTAGPTADHTTTNTDNMCYGTVINANYGAAGSAYLTSPVFDLAGTSNPIINVWLDMNTQSPTNGGTIQLRVQKSGVWGNWTTINATDPGYLANAPNSTDIAAFGTGVPGWTGTVPAGNWELTMIDLSNLTTTNLTGITDTDLFQIRFWFNSTSNGTGFPGWFVDDFSILYSKFPGLWKKTSTSTDWSNTANWDDNALPNTAISVKIPDACAFYPEIDETVNALKVLIEDGGSLTVKTGGILNVSQFIEVGEGLSGTLTITDGTVNITNGLHSRAGSTINFNGGTVNLTDIRQTLNIAEAAGNFNFTGGTINATGNVEFSASAGGTMSGNFELNIDGNLVMNYNSGTNLWTSITGGTVNMDGSVATSISSSAGNEVRVFDLNIINPNGVTVSGDLRTFNNLIIAENSFSDFQTGKQVTVDGNFTLKSDFKGTALLMHDNNLTVAGTSTVQRYLSNENWHYLGMPVPNVQRSLFHPENFYRYNETIADSWNTTDFLSSETGWQDDYTGNILASNQLDGFAYLYYESVLNYTGIPNSGPFSKTLSNTPSGFGAQFDGWNLIGNPYPSNLDWTAIANEPANADLDKTIYFYADIDGVPNTNYYAYYNATTGIGVNSGTRYIPSGQGFFVKTSINGANLSVTNNMRTLTAQNFYKKTEQHTPIIHISVSNNNFSDQTAVALALESSPEFDSDFDAYKILHQSDKMPFIYTIADKNIPLAINTLPYDENKLDIPLHIRAPENGEYIISSALQNFEFIEYVDLFDRQTQNTYNLKTNKNLVFKLRKGDNNHRFVLRFAKTQAENNELAFEKSIKVLVNAQSLIINTEKPITNANVLVFDVLGRVISNQSFPALISTAIEVEKTGVYMVKVQSGNNVCTHKVFIE